MEKTNVKLINDLEFLLSSPKNISIVTHYNPDGDALGSALAMYFYLIQKNHNVQVILPNSVAYFLQWLPGLNHAIIYDEQKNKADQFIEQSDVIINLDFNDFDRLNIAEEKVKNAQATKVLIDHHPKPLPYFDLAFSDINVSSTAELIYTVIVELGDKDFINKDIATCLFTGIMTDTVCFKVNSAGAITFRITAELLKYKINKEEIYYLVYDNYSIDRMKLLGHCLNKNLHVLTEYKTAYITLTIEEQKQYNLQKGDTEGFVNHSLAIKNIHFGVFFMERDEYIKVSLRSKNNFHVGDFARNHFGGGGHRNAAGAESELSLDETIDKFKSLLPLYKENLI